MAENLDKNIAPKFGNCFRVINVEKKEGNKNKTRFQSDVYICVHAYNVYDKSEFVWLFTTKEFEQTQTTYLSNLITKHLEKGYVYPIRIDGRHRYLVKIADLNGTEVILSVGVTKSEQLKRRAEVHKNSIVARKKNSIFNIFS